MRARPAGRPAPAAAPGHRPQAGARRRARPLAARPARHLRSASPWSALAAGLFAGGAVNGLPAGWGGAHRPRSRRADRLAPRLPRRCRHRRAVPDRDHRHRRARSASRSAMLGLGLTAEERRWLAARRLRGRADDGDEEDLPVPGGPAGARAGRPPRRRRAARSSPTGKRDAVPPAAARAPALARARRQLHPAVGRPAQSAAAAGAQRRARQGRARAQRPPARIGARRFLGQGRDRRGPARPGRHHVRARAGQRHQGEPGHPARRRHRPQHVGARRRASPPFPAAR